MHRATGGNPRLINLVCDRALLVRLFRPGDPNTNPRSWIESLVPFDSSPLELWQASQVVANMTGSVLNWMRRRVAAL